MLAFLHATGKRDGAFGPLKTAFVGHRMTTDDELEAFNLSGVFRIGDDHPRCLQAMIAAGPCHCRCSFTDRQNGIRRRGECGKRRRQCTCRCRRCEGCIETGPCCSDQISGHSVTGLGRSLPAKNAFRLSTTVIPMAFRVSTVAEPRCGSRTVFGAPRRRGLITGSP